MIPMEGRLKELEEIRKMGFEPYGGRFERTHKIIEIREEFSHLKPGEKLEDVNVKVAGRIKSIRRHGKLSFADIEDFSGRIQIYVSTDYLSEKEYKLFKKLNLGDIIGVEGGIVRTKKGELSVLVKQLHLLTKALKQIPFEWFGLKDVELRYRKRYLDLLLNQNVRETFLRRNKIISAIREFLNSKGFIEVETPMLQVVPGGATARPFITYHNALGINLYLRIAPELFLKRLIVGGFEKVYEINRNFRNEGIDTKHNPEFTMLEWYWAYADYNDNMKLTEELITYVARKVLGKLKIKYQGKDINLTPPWPRIPMIEALKEFVGIDVEGKSVEELRNLCEKKGLEIKRGISKGEIIAGLFEELVQPKLFQPTFIIDYPLEVSPLAKEKKDNPQLVERFELIIAGEEIANAYSELADPIEQKKRFLEQLEKRRRGDEEAHMMDEDFIEALEYGMPPTSGCGIGVDRLVMLFTDSPSIRDVILFPTLRPKEGKKEKKKVFGDEVKDIVFG
jgi:lysyl-tRNA synthetase class 2